MTIFSRRSFSKFHDTLCLQCGKDMEDVDKRRRFFPGYKRTNVCENIELITVVIGRVHCSETTLLLNILTNVVCRSCRDKNAALV